MSFSFPATFYDIPVSSEQDTRTPSYAVHAGGGLPHDPDGEAAPVDAEKRLAAMDTGFLFAGRYRLESGSVNGKPHCRFAVERTSGRPVCLKFFVGRRQEYNNAIAMHRALQAQHKHVCRLLEAVEDAAGFPPCLVLERGRYALSDRMAGRPMADIEQRALLHSVLEVLECVHGEGVVHGQVDPAHLMWFASDFSWKLISLTKASHVGAFAALPTGSRYASPEAIRSAADGTRVRLEVSVDMWSFGVLAFEVLTGSSVTDSAGIREYVDRRLGMPSSVLSTDEWLSGGQRRRVDAALEKQQLLFVQSMLCENAEARPSARRALNGAFFEPASDASQLTGGVEVRRPASGLFSDCLTAQIVAEQLPSGLSPERRQHAFVYFASRHLDHSLHVECFTEEGASSLPFYEREAQDAWTFFDAGLPRHPVHVVKRGRRLRLRLDLVLDSTLRVPIFRVLSVFVSSPDAEGQSLDVVQWREEGSITALAHLDPAQFESARLGEVSPHFAPASRKYVKLSVRTRVQLCGESDQQLDLHDIVYCKVVRPRHQARLRKRVARCFGWKEGEAS